MDQIILSDHCVAIEYAHFVLEILKDKERKRRKFYSQCMQINMRKKLISLITDLTEQLKFNSTTLHLSIYMLDSFMDSYEIREYQVLKLITIVCLILAAKFEEKDNSVPKISEIKPLVDVEFDENTFIEIEFSILKFFNFSLFLPTAAHFIEYYILFSYSHEDEKYNIYKKDLKENIQRVAGQFLETSFMDISYLSFPPSMVAASCIACARRTFGLTSWTSTLESTTEYELHQLNECMEYLNAEYVPMAHKRKRRFMESIDQGYATATSSASNSPNSPKQSRNK